MGFDLPLLNRRRRAGGFSPAVLFAGGEQGTWLDPSDPATLFQDTAGTTPVTAQGQIVRLIQDKSGRGNHASLATSGPTYQVDVFGRSYLALNGVDNWLSTASINFTTDKITVWAGAYLATPQSNNSPIVQIGDTTTSATDALVRIMAGDGSTASVRWSAHGTAANLTPRVAISYPNTSVYSATLNGTLSGASELALRLNAANVAVGSATDSGITSIGSQIIYIGRQHTTVGYLNGRLYGLIVRGAASTTDQITNTETWLNNKTGAY